MSTDSPRTPPRAGSREGAPPRATAAAYDAIPMATILPQSPIGAQYGGGLHAPSAHATSYGGAYASGTYASYQSAASVTQAHAATSATYQAPRVDRSAADALVNDMFSSLNLGSPSTPSSTASRSGGYFATTPPRSPIYGGSGIMSVGYEHREREDSARVSSTSPVSYGAQSPKAQHSLYKTELCRSWEESGACRYGHKCQFAHGRDELRPVLRHPKYKTEVCRTFAQQGACPYGSRCRFIHYRDAASAQSALGALVSGVNVSDWGDFLGTPAPLDPRPHLSSFSPVSSPSTASPTEPMRSTTEDERTAVDEAGYETPRDDDDVVRRRRVDSILLDRDIEEHRDRALGDASSESDVDDLRRLPVFSTIAASPERVFQD